MSRLSTAIILVLLVVIVLLAWLLTVRSAEAPSVQNGDVVTAPPPTPGTGPVPAPGPRPLHERVSVTAPKSNATVGKKFIVTGRAPGNWYFEASAPIMVVDTQGNKLAQSYIQAQGDWMTTELVDFKGDVNITSAYAGPATLVLMKDNPSGLPEHDDSLEVPIVIQ